MTDFLPMLLLSVGGAAIVSYIGLALTNEDGLFFIRKRQFKNKVLKNGHRNISDLVGSLMETTGNDWENEGDFMVYQPYPNTRIFFEDFYGLKLDIIESKINIFNLCYLNDSKEFSHWYDYIAKGFLQEEDAFKTEQVLFYLKDLFEKINIHEENSAHEQKQEKAEETFEEHFGEAWSPIPVLLAQLKQDVAWLSVESCHQINETFPKDIYTLQEVYRVVQDKEKARADVEYSLHAIHNKLKRFQEEAEKNKLFAIKKTKIIIERR